MEWDGFFVVVTESQQTIQFFSVARQHPLLDLTAAGLGLLCRNYSSKAFGFKAHRVTLLGIFKNPAQ